MRSFVRMLFLASLAGNLASMGNAGPSAQSQNKVATGSISGRVTLGGKPAAGVTVLLTPSDYYGPIEKPLPKATTDDEGHFSLTNVPAGNYLLQTFTLAYVAPSDDMRGRAGKLLNLSEGEAVEGIDIALTRGGVITGKIMEANGQPLIQESVRLTTLDERDQKRPFNMPFFFMQTTDDRGVYRLFGVPPGRYIVSVGMDTSQGAASSAYGPPHPLTYHLTDHPGVTDQSKATVVEVQSGSEAIDVDISVGRSESTYKASGHIVDADTGKPVSGVSYAYGSIEQGGKSFSSFSPGRPANSRGEFQIEGVLPGRYAAFVTATEPRDFYSDPALFEVIAGDITGLEIKVHRGSSISGVVIVEGDHPEDALRVPNLRLGVHIESETLTTPASVVSIPPDGSFRATGLQPGKVSLFLATYPPPKGLSLLRVERDGVEQTQGFDIGAAEQVTGVRIVLGYGTGVIRGAITIEGGKLAQASRNYVMCRRISDNQSYSRGQPPVFADARGRFNIEGLMPGEYEISITTTVVPVSGGAPRVKSARVTASVTNGAETQATLVIDLNQNKD